MEIPFNPLDREFNIAVMAITKRLLPGGYDVSEDAPQTYAGLRYHYNRTGRILVWSGASDKSIFDCPEHNWAFRAWHDYWHLQLWLPFTPEGECAVARCQYADLIDQYGEDDERLPRWKKIIAAEVVGHVAYSMNHDGAFPVDQMAFMQAALVDPVAACAASARF